MLCWPYLSHTEYSYQIAQRSLIVTLYLLKTLRLELFTHKTSPPPSPPPGCSEALMAGAVMSEAVSVAGKEVLAWTPMPATP